MTKSKQVQALVKYLQSPKAIHLSNISMVNRTAKTMLTILRISMSSSLSCKLMSSKHRLKLEAKIKSRMVHSKNGLSTKSKTICRNESHPLSRQVPRMQHHKLEQRHALVFRKTNISVRCKNYMLACSGKQGSGIFLTSSSSVLAPMACVLPSVPSPNVRLFWPVGIKYSSTYNDSSTDEKRLKAAR